MGLREDPLPIPRRFTLIMTVAAPLLLFHCWRHRLVVMDDPWISFRYAANLLSGNGLSFNPGEWLEGYSNLLWVLLSTVPVALHIEPLGAMRAVSLAIALAMLVSLTAGLRRWLPRSGFAAMAIAAAVPFAVWTMGGLETILHSALLLAFGTAVARLVTTPDTRSEVATGVIGALLVLSRPEGFGFLLLLPLLLFLRNPRPRLIRLCICLAIFLAIYTVWRGYVFGSITANTATAKMGGPLGDRIMAGLRHQITGANGGWLVLWLLTAWGVIQVLRNPAADWRRPLLLVLAALSAAQSVFVLVAGGDWMPAGRFLVPAIPCLALAAGLATWYWNSVLRGLLLLLLIGGGVLESQRDPMLRWCRWAAREQGGGLLTEPLAIAGRSLAVRAEPGDLVAGTEAGVIPFLARTPFLDTAGLVDAHIARRDGALHYKMDSDYVLSRRPRFVVLTLQGNRAPFPQDADLLTRSDFTSVYTPVQRIPRLLPDGQWGLVPSELVIFERTAHE